MSRPFRVLVTGSRTWTDVRAIFEALDIVAVNGHRTVVVVHGGCPRGADAMAEAWVRRRADRGWPVSAERHGAQWDVLGKRAGFVRNQHMVQLGADCAIAFIHNGSRGASHCAGLAEAAGIPTQRVERASTSTEGSN